MQNRSDVLLIKTGELHTAQSWAACAFSLLVNILRAAELMKRVGFRNTLKMGGEPWLPAVSTVKWEKGWPYTSTNCFSVRQVLGLD